MTTPILLNQLNCPYSQRARMALTYAGIDCEFKEINAADLPKEIKDFKDQLRLPLLMVNNRILLDHSIDIMHWALLQNDPDGWIEYEVDCLDQMRAFIKLADSSFAQDVLRYVSWDQSAKRSRADYRKDCELFIAGLEERLEKTDFLFGQRQAIADIAVFPFVALFTQVELEWFRKALYPHVWQWLDCHLESDLFKSLPESQLIIAHDQATDIVNKQVTQPSTLTDHSKEI